MEYKNKIHNSSVVLNVEWACTINCPGCNFWVKDRAVTNKLNLNDIKERIDFASENLSDWYSLILLPWNVLLEYSEDEVEEIIVYACSKQKLVQWELEKIDEKILTIFENQKIKQLIKNQQLFLNIWYIAWKLNLLNKIYIELCKLWIENIRDILIENNLLDDFINLDSESKLIKLKDLEKLWILPWWHESIDLAIHCWHWKLKRKDIISFLEKEWFTIDENEIVNLEKNSWNLHFHSSEAWVLITLHYTPIQKIDKYWNNIWKLEHKKWNEECILTNRSFEWSIWWDKEWTILPHSNPCINKLSFWNLNSSQYDLNKAFELHKRKILWILIKYKYNNGFNQSELCNKCLSNEEIELTRKDFIKFHIREFTFKFKKICSNILFK